MKSANLDMDSKEVSIVYNPAKTDADRLRGIITKEGYDADSIPADPHAYTRLKSCYTKEGHKH